MTDILRTMQAQLQKAVSTEQEDGDGDSGHASGGAVDWERLREVSPRWEETVERMSQVRGAEPMARVEACRLQGAGVDP